METSSWRLQDAKARFSALVDAALAGAPQHVTRRGQRAVVVLSESEYQRLQATANAAAPSFVDHLRAMPRAPMTVAASVPKRPALRLRDVDLG